MISLLAQANVRSIPLRSESVDMIFTDPPYPKQYLLCYEWLANEAGRVLKPGGFIFAMAGEYWINRIFAIFEQQKELSYFWRFTHLALSGEAPFVMQRRVVAHAKSILAYTKGPGPYFPRIGGVHGVYTGRKDKRYYHWGQDVDTARYYVDCFSAPGDLILDPFIGGGTLAIACELLQRQWIGFDIEQSALVITRKRLADERTAPAYPLELPLFSRPVGAPGELVSRGQG